MIKKSLISAALAVSMFALSSVASATPTPMTNWYVDTDGVGGNAPVQVVNYLDLVGGAYVHNSFTSPTTFSFNEVGNFVAGTTDGGPGTSAFPLPGFNLSPVLTALFTGSGTGTLGGSLSFTPGGMLEIFSGSTNIANFTLLSGSANLFANSTLPNGTVSLIFQASSMLSGYFFDSLGHDLKASVDSIDGLVIGMATTNVTSYNTPVTSGLINQYNTAFSPDVTGPINGNGTTDLLLSNNGQFAMAVPEPSMLSLLGLALVGVGFTTRRKSKV